MMLTSSQMGVVYEWEKWCKEIPQLKFKPDWEVQVIPPIVGAVVRFRVTKGKKTVSVYLDCYDNLGYFGSPYWEIYPDKDDNNARFPMGDTEALLKAIDKALAEPVENWQWIEIKSDAQAELFYNMGGKKVRFGKDDTRERELCYGEPMMAVDDGGGSALDSFYGTEQPPEVYLDVNKFKRVTYA